MSNQCFSSNFFELLPLTIISIYKVDKMHLQIDHNTVTKGHRLKPIKEPVTARQRRSNFRDRVMNRWNSLTEDVFSACK